MSTWVIVVAGGNGSRFGATPKQFSTLNGRSVLERSLAVAETVGDGLVLVLPEDFADSLTTDRTVVAGGATRSESVRCGLAAVPDEADIVVIHDAARPLASPALFKAVVEAIEGGADAAVPGVPVADTLKRVHGNHVVETVNREELVAVQTPQAFRASALRQAHAGNPEASDDAGLVEAAGGKVVVVPGEPRNFKITVADDLLIATALVANE